MVKAVEMKTTWNTCSSEWAWGNTDIYSVHQHTVRMDVSWTCLLAFTLHISVPLCTWTKGSPWRHYTSTNVYRSIEAVSDRRWWTEHVTNTPDDGFSFNLSLVCVYLLRSAIQCRLQSYATLCLIALWYDLLCESVCVTDQHTLYWSHRNEEWCHASRKLEDVNEYKTN